MTRMVVTFVVSFIVMSVIQSLVRRSKENPHAEEDRRRRLNLDDVRTWVLVVALAVTGLFTTLLIGVRGLEIRDGGAGDGLLPVIFLMLLLDALFLRALAVRWWKARSHRPDGSGPSRSRA